MLRKKSYISLFIGLTVLFCSGKAFAYKTGEVEINAHGRVSEAYDTNVTYANTNPLNDFTTTLSAGLDLNYEGRVSSLGFVGNVDQQFFVNNPKFENTSEDFALNYAQDLSNLEALTVSDVFDHTYEPRSFEDTLGRTNGRYSYIRNKVNVAYNRTLTKQLSLLLGYYNQMDFFSRSDIADSYLNSGSVELDYYLTAKTVFLGFYDFSIRKFDPGTDATTNRSGGGLRQFFTDQLYVDVTGGVDAIDSFDNTKSVNPFVIASVTDDINERTIINGKFKKERYTIPYAQDIYDYWEISGLITSQLLARLSSSFSVFFGRGEYVKSGVSDDLFGMNMGATYELTKKINLIASYRYYSDTSDTALRGYNKNTVTVGLSGKF